jgi:hypothetical protein
MQAESQKSYQQRVDQWIHFTFDANVANDVPERAHRFVEEALELAQATGCTVDDAHKLVDYVFGRPAGNSRAEVGGTMLTLTTLATAIQCPLMIAAEDELERVSTPAMVAKLRAKHASKKAGQPLPGTATSATDKGVEIAELEERARFLRKRMSELRIDFPEAYDRRSDELEQVESRLQELRANG